MATLALNNGPATVAVVLNRRGLRQASGGPGLAPGELSEFQELTPKWRGGFKRGAESVMEAGIIHALSHRRIVWNSSGAASDIISPTTSESGLPGMASLFANDVRIFV